MPTLHLQAALLFVCLLACPRLAFPQDTLPPDDEGFLPLLNGQDLDGWVSVNTASSTWKFEDSLLVCSGKPIGEIRTERMYQNFVMEIEWRHMVPGGNAGIFVWADDITAKGQPFHRGIEVQVLENAYGNTQSYTTHGDIFPIHGATMTPINGRGGSRAFPIENRSNPSPQWNHYRITCIDGNIALEVNGKLVTQGRDCRPKKGYICLESEGGVVHYRNARIKELPATPIEADEVAIANRGYRCLYNGIDLEGWVLSGAQGENWQPRDWILSYRGNESSDLATTEEFTDFGFILDFRMAEQPSLVKLRPRGSDRLEIVIDPADPDWTAVLKGGRAWHRIEGQLKGDLLNVTCDGVPIIADQRCPDVPVRGPLILTATGPTEFANPYVRNLDETKGEQ